MARCWGVHQLEAAVLGRLVQRSSAMRGVLPVHIHLPRTPRLEDGLLRIPISATPQLRIPLFWLGFRHLPRPVLRACLNRTLAADGRLVLFFHPWELLKLDRRLPMPTVVRRGGGPRLERRLETELKRLKDRAEFARMGDLVSK